MILVIFLLTFGRSGEESEGEFTFVYGTGRNVKDYFLVSSELFNLAEHFKVENFDVSCQSIFLKTHDMAETQSFIVKTNDIEVFP